MLVAQIPSEALIAYTTLLALFHSVGDSYKIGRWILYVCAVLACGATVLASYLAKRDYTFHQAAGVPLDAASTSTPGSDSSRGMLRGLHLPYLPTAAAMTSMAVYGLTVPGSPLQFEVSDNAFSILSASLAVGGAMVMSIIAPFLGKGNDAKPAGNG